MRRVRPEDEGDRQDEAPRVTPFHWLMLAAGAVRRRKVLALGVFLAGVAASTTYYLARPPIYRVETKILAQRQQALPSAVRSAYEDVPTRSAWEIIHRRENLIALIRETGLLEAARSPETKPRLPRWLSLRSAEAAADDPLEELVTVLDEQLLVAVEDGTIAIRLDWRDPRQAYAIVRAALQNFLEARHLQEVKAIDEVISVLQGRAAALREELDSATEDARRRAARAPRQAAPRVRTPSGELVRLQSLLEAKVRAIQDVEEFRRRRLADLQAQLDRARNELSDQHPSVIGMRKDIAALSRESPQIEALREEERKARKEYTDRAAREGFPLSAVAVTAPPPPHGGGPPQQLDERVRQAQIQYEQMTARVNAAQAELDTARAAFKYRYNVIWPPQPPREPVSPKAWKIFPLGVLAALVLALAAAAAPDVLTGRVVQRWQVERVLDLEILGEVDRRS